MTHRVVVIGAGIGGLGLAIRLRQAGIDDVVVLERSDGIGGTWRHNTYPGAACDVPSHLYSYSFAPNPGWSRAYAAQPEILAYLERCADDHGVRDVVRTGVTVAGASWSDADRRWAIETIDGEVLHAEVLVSAVGMLDVPAVPAIGGLDDFAGPVVHTARWPADLDLAGRRVGVIGTGASAVQVVPAIAGLAASVTLFQRSAPYVVPRVDPPFDDDARRRFAEHPAEQAALRQKLYRRHEDNTMFHVADPRLDGLAAFALDHLATQVADVDLRARLTPDHHVGCKRVLVSSSYYPALCRDDVTLVTDAIERVVPGGVVTVDGTDHELDVLVLATGFRAADYLGQLDVRGTGGVRLHDVWADGATAYLGMAVAGFPNLFVLYGPNTNQGGNSIIVILEAQAAYVVAALGAMEVAGVDVVAVKPAVHEAWDDETLAAMDGTVWLSGCRNYFTDGTGRV